MIIIEIPGTPVPKERARRACSGHWYTPPKTQKYELMVAKCGLIARARAPKIEPPYTVTVRLFLPDRRRRDIDNIFKAKGDGLNGVIWLDDTEIEQLHVEKAMDRENPRAEVVVEQVREKK